MANEFYVPWQTVTIHGSINEFKRVSSYTVHVCVESGIGKIIPQQAKIQKMDRNFDQMQISLPFR